MSRPAIIVLASLFLPAVANADPPELAITADLSDDRVPGPAMDETAVPGPVAADPVVVFLNYDGVTLSSGGFGGDDATANTSNVCSATFQPYGSGAKRDASVQATRVDWEQFNIQIVTERPAAGAYTMNVVGIAPCGPQGGGAGVAPMDCGNQNPNNISFTFAAESQQWSADVVATINSQEIAHTFGLDHVDHPPDIMNPVAGIVEDPSFLDECLPSAGAVFCSDQHAQHCDPGQQNAVQELLGILGPSAPDLEAPTVAITSPEDGLWLEPGAVTVTAQASDDIGITEVDLIINGEEQGAPSSAAPHSWPLQLPQDGEYTFEVVALDAAGNSATSEPVTVYVGEEEDEPTAAGTAGDDGDETGAGFGDGADIQDDPSVDGCGCRSGGKDVAPAALLTLALLSLRRPGRKMRARVNRCGGPQ